jgi:sarcosine oxidase, subunit beta
VRQLQELPKTADVVIIGAGIVGCATAFFLARTGRSPLLIERSDSIASATTAVSAHAIRCQFAERENIDQCTESLRIYETFRDVIGDPSAQINLVQNGYLFASTDDADRPVFEARVARQHSLGVDDVELLSGDEIRYRFPWMSPEICLGTFRQKDGWIDSVLAANHFLAASGALTALKTNVTAIETTAGRVTGVMTNRGRVATSSCVLAAGPFSRDISPEALPLARWRRHRIVLDADERIPQSAPMTIDANTGAHWRPHAGGALMAWAQAEIDRPATWPVERDESWPDLILRSEGGVARLCPFWNDITPELTPDQYLFTAGQYTVTPDHKPLIGPANQTEGLYLNTGYSGHGIMGSPSGSRLLADLLAGTASSTDNPFHPGRFAAGAKPPDVEQIVL